MEWDRRGRDGTVGGGKTSEGTEEQRIGGKGMGEMERSGMGWDGMGWDGIEGEGMGQKGTGWDSRGWKDK